MELVLFSAQVSKVKMHKEEEGVSQNQGHVIPMNEECMNEAWQRGNLSLRGTKHGKFILHFQKLL